MRLGCRSIVPMLGPRAMDRMVHRVRPLLLWFLGISWFYATIMFLNNQQLDDQQSTKFSEKNNQQLVLQQSTASSSNLKTMKRRLKWWENSPALSL